MSRILFLFCQMLLLISFVLTCSQPGAQAQEPIKRKILALYDGSKVSDIEQTLIHKMVEMPLNHLGLDVRYMDVQKELPSLDSLSDFRGVVTWFAGPVQNGVEYLKWADKAAQHGLKFLVMSNIGAKVDKTTLPVINRFLKHVGVRMEVKFVSETAGTKVLKLDREIVEFEFPLYKVIPVYDIFTAVDARTISHLSVRPPTQIADVEAVLITSAPGGGFVQAAFAANHNDLLRLEKWLINPFKYFAKVFEVESFPIPDVTTTSGRRIYFSHVDGDGWNNISLIERYRQKKTSASEVMLNELIAPYPDLPVTVGLVTGDLDPSIGGSLDAVAIARKIYLLDQVEVGSHTHTHPFDWRFFEKYDRRAEQKMIEEQGGSGSNQGSLSGLISVGQSSREQNQRYIAGSAKMPRAYLKQAFDLEKDIVGSLALAESYAPKGKKAMLMQWTGDTMAFEAAIAATRRVGARNINGGDPRFDGHYPSIIFVPPISRMVGSQRQIYAAGSNENTYTNDWTGPYYGFRELTKTLDNTEFPRRLKPFNLYYHTYSAERYASLRAVKQHLEKARNGSYTPIPASQYAAIADSFFDVEITQNSKHNWSVKNRAELQTLRFDDADNIQLDWDNSRGVLGTNRHAGALFIALDAAVGEITIATKPMQKPEQPPRPSLHNSRWLIENLKFEECNISFNAHGFGNGQMLWQGLASGHYQVSAERDGKPLWHANIDVADDGKLEVEIPVRAIDPLEISFTCDATTSTASLEISGER